MIELLKDTEAYHAAYRRSVENPEAFWAEVASTFHWQRPWDKVLEWNFDQPKVRWFEGAQTNLCYNAVDRHALLCPDRTALIWEPNEAGEQARQWTYAELQEAVIRTAGMLQDLGVRPSDRVCLYMPMVPELLWTVLS